MLDAQESTLSTSQFATKLGKCKDTNRTGRTRVRNNHINPIIGNANISCLLQSGTGYPTIPVTFDAPFLRQILMNWAALLCAEQGVVGTIFCSFEKKIAQGR